MMITIDQLKRICPFGPRDMDKFIPYLNTYMAIYGIDSLEPARMFIAQVAHESGQFRYVQEIASGRAYEGRKDLGNIEKGDGVKFKGRSLIQTTGRANYIKVGKELGLDLISNPALLESPEWAVAAACYYWHSHNLNRFANDIIKCTKAINGGLNGLDDRKILWERAKKTIK